MNLTYIPPLLQKGEVVVKLTDGDIEVEDTMWLRAIVMYVVGNTSSIGAIERFIATQW